MIVASQGFDALTAPGGIDLPRWVCNDPQRRPVMSNITAVGLDLAKNVRYPDSPAERTVGTMPPQIAEMLVPDIQNWTCPTWPLNWNGHANGRLERSSLDQMLGKRARGQQ